MIGLPVASLTVAIVGMEPANDAPVRVCVCVCVCVYT